MSTSRGRVLAAVLSRSWYASPPLCGPSLEELELHLRDLLRGGLAGLAWQRLRTSPLAESSPATELRNAYRHQALAQRRQDINIGRLAANLRSAGIDAILLKGWAVARLYREPALRPYGDFNLLVRSDEREATGRGGFAHLCPAPSRDILDR